MKYTVTVDVPPGCERMQLNLYYFKRGQTGERAVKRATLRITPDGKHRATDQDTGNDLPPDIFRIARVED